MCERFNSGMGGYTCDGCAVLLWSGHQGALNPENRIYCYTTKKEDVIQIGNSFFCKKCGADELLYHSANK